MAEIELTPDRLIVRVTGIDRILSMTSSLEIPLAHVTGADGDEEEARRIWHGLRVGGVPIPGLLREGSFLSHGELVFWDVHDPARAVVVSLRHEKYERLVVGVEDPGATVEAIRAAVRDLNGESPA
ncbi:MAG TPA: hypothetical protein VIA06_24115 [Candidatus Dormibacteraeota bacterium]|jgi:hypothetical protein|nr:hypothetical protein [Candidatus Dormibacteraeota bacterium]